MYKLYNSDLFNALSYLMTVPNTILCLYFLIRTNLKIYTRPSNQISQELANGINQLPSHFLHAKEPNQRQPKPKQQKTKTTYVVKYL